MEETSKGGHINDNLVETRHVWNLTYFFSFEYISKSQQFLKILENFIRFETTYVPTTLFVCSRIS